MFIRQNRIIYFPSCVSARYIQEQQAAEKDIMEKIRQKVDQIRASQQNVRAGEYHEPVTHFQGEWLRLFPFFRLKRWRRETTQMKTNCVYLIYSFVSQLAGKKNIRLRQATEG